MVEAVAAVKEKRMAQHTASKIYKVVVEIIYVYYCDQKVR